MDEFRAINTAIRTSTGCHYGVKDLSFGIPEVFSAFREQFPWRERDLVEIANELPLVGNQNLSVLHESNSLDIIHGKVFFNRTNKIHDRFISFPDDNEISCFFG